MTTSPYNGKYNNNKNGGVFNNYVDEVHPKLLAKQQPRPLFLQRQLSNKDMSGVLYKNNGGFDE